MRANQMSGCACLRLLHTRATAHVEHMMVGRHCVCRAAMCRVELYRGHGSIKGSLHVNARIKISILLTHIVQTLRV